MTLALLTLTLLADIAPTPWAPPPKRAPPPAQCSSNDQCVLSTFQGCCGSCCSSDPHAIPKGTKEGQICATVDCALPDCAAVKCARPRPVSEFEAVCRSGQCVAEPKGQPPLQCRSDTECAVSFSPAPGAACTSSPCGCCPYPRAVWVEEERPRPVRPGPAPQSPAPPGKPTFGLSTGDGRPEGPPRPQCSPCPPPPPLRAVCRANQCVLQPSGPPRPLPPG